MTILIQKEKGEEHPKVFVVLDQTENVPDGLDVKDLLVHAALRVRRYLKNQHIIRLPKPEGAKR